MAGVPQDFLLKFRNEDDRMREQWLSQAQKQEKLIKLAKQRVLARVSTAPNSAGPHSASTGEFDAFPRPATQSHSAPRASSSSSAALAHTSPGRLQIEDAHSRRPPPVLAALSDVGSGLTSDDSNVIEDRPLSRRNGVGQQLSPIEIPRPRTAIDELSRLDELAKVVKQERKAIRKSTTASTAVLEQFLKHPVPQ